MYTKRDKMHLLLFKHTLIRSKYKLVHLRSILIFQAYTIQLYINEMIKNISKIPEHIP